MHHGEARLWRRIEALRGCAIAQYAGNPASFPPTLGLIDDSDSPNASNFNACFGQGQSDRTMWLRQRIRGLRAQNWYGELPFATFLPAGLAFLTAAWDPFNSAWIIGANSAPTSVVYFTYGMDPQAIAGSATVTQVGGTMPVFTNMALAADPTTPNVYWCAGINDDGAHDGNVYIYRYAAGTWTLNFTYTFVTVPFGGLQRVNLLPFGSSIILAAGNGTTGGPGGQLLVYNGVNWTGTGGLPITPAVGDVGICSNASNGGPNNLAIAFPRCAGSVSSNTYWTTNNASAWTIRTFAFQTTTGIIEDIVWTVDVNGPCFLAAHYDSGTTKTTFWRSSDGINWTPSGAPTTSIQVVGMAAIGEQVVGTLVDNGSGGGAGTVFSIDGGATWYFGQATLSASLASSDKKYLRARPFASPIGFIALNGPRIRYSHLQALPAANL